MAPTWSSRFLSGSSDNTNNAASPRSSAPRDKPLSPNPRPQQGPPFDPNNLTALPTLARPRTAGSPGTHMHNRSISHPLPLLFSRKKSAGNLNRTYSNQGDITLDDSLVPVLDDSSGEIISTEPGKIGSLRKKDTRQKSTGDQDGKSQRRCFCCDSRVKVPQDLDKFRCMCCLTINDLKPVAERREEDLDARKGKNRDVTIKRGPPSGVQPPLSIERTRAIIDRCLLLYLQSRCQRPEAAAPMKEGITSGSLTKSPTDSDEMTLSLSSRRDEQRPVSRSLGDTRLSSSPATSPSFGFAPGALPSDNADTGQDTYLRQESLCSGSRSPNARMNIGTAPSKQASLTRKPVHPQHGRKPPPASMNLSHKNSSQNLRPNLARTVSGERSPRLQLSPMLSQEEINSRKRYDRIKSIFRPLEDYLLSNFGNYDTLNASFSTVRPAHAGRTRSESHISTPPPEPMRFDGRNQANALDELDAKTLLLGDIGENGSWWTGRAERDGESGSRRKKIGSGDMKPVTSKSANINWSQVATWYRIIHTADLDWQRKLDHLRDVEASSRTNIDGPANVQEVQDELAEAREHVVRTLLKITENMLKRPGRPLKTPEELRFLLIMLANPSLYPSKMKTSSQSPRQPVAVGTTAPLENPPLRDSPRKSPGKDGGQHSGILKRIFGLLGNSSDTSHRYLIGWFSRFDEEHFISLVDLCASFVTHRISRRSHRPRSRSQLADGGLIPDLSGGAMNTSAQLHAAMGLSGSIKKRSDDPDQETDWAGDWQIKGAAKLMSLLFAANNIWQGKRKEDNIPRVDSGVSDKVIRPQDKARRSGQLLHTSTFYNTLLDYQDLIVDFKVWESKRDKFAFCQYPFFLSMGAKIKILEYDARRQMEIKAREAYFDQVIRQRAIDGHFHLRVRRDCMVDDSLRQISEAVGSGQEELKKGLRVHFSGEEGVDAGGPRKEWFLMLVREVFDADHGLFVYDDQSRTCYFNPSTFETSDQYYLVGALLGLAIYNSTILDIALPPFAFRKLLAAAPVSSVASNVAVLTGTKGQMTYTLADLAEYKPALAAGLHQLLEFDGDVESTYCWCFVVPMERYGTVVEVPLVPNGEKKPVTNANRAEFVDAYIRYLLDTAVARQFEPFKRGFFTVCAGNALSLFRAEEIELLVRGSDETLDVDSLKAVAVYENWRHAHPPHAPIPDPGDNVDVVRWFWEAFASAPPDKQRKLLTFITGSDRIPAVGATSLVLKVMAGGDGWSGTDAEGRAEKVRFPVARTCFNLIVLWRYEDREQLEQRLWRAVDDSEGFGLK